MSDRLIDMLLTEWAKHRAEGIRKGFDQRHEWGPCAPEWAHRECDKWVAMDEAHRLIVGTRLADDAIRQREGER